MIIALIFHTKSTFVSICSAKSIDCVSSTSTSSSTEEVLGVLWAPATSRRRASTVKLGTPILRNYETDKNKMSCKCILVVVPILVTLSVTSVDIFRHAPRGDAMQFAFLPAAAAAGAMRLERLTALSEDCDEDGEAAVTPHASSKHSSHAVSPLTFGGGGGAGTADSSKRKCVDRSSTGSLDSDGNDISFKVNDISAIVGDHGSADQLADALKKIVEITAENESKVTMLDDSKKTIATLQKQVEKLAALVARKDDEMDALIAEHDVEMSANAECEQEWAEERRILQVCTDSVAYSLYALS